jgi:MFS family permease
MTERHKERARGWRGVWQNRRLRRLLVASAVSNTGDWLYSVALVVYVFEATHSAAWVGASVFAIEVAYIVFSAPGGTFADRYDRRRFLVVTGAAQASVLTAMTVIAAVDGPALAMIALSFLASVLSAANGPAMFAAVPAIADEDDLASANAAVSAIESTALLAGPALGALVLAVSSTVPAFAVDAVTFLVAIACIAGLGDLGRGSGEERASMLTELRTGARVVLETPAARVVIVMISGALFWYGCERVLFVLVAADKIGTGPEGLTILVAAVGLGALAASLVTGRIARRAGAVPVMVAAFLASGLSFAALAVISTPFLAYLAALIDGAGFAMFEICSITVLQRSVSADLLGRVFGIQMSVGAMSTLLASVLAPALASGVSLDVALAIGGGVSVLVIVLVAPWLRKLDREAAARGRELEPVVAALAGSPLFEGADTNELEQLAIAAVEKRVRPGKVIIRQGDPADSLYVIREGCFMVSSTRDGDGQTNQVGQLGPGDWFGEIGIIKRVPRTATVISSTDGVVWRLPAETFLATFGDGALPQALRTGIATRLSATLLAHRGAAEVAGA